MGDEMDYTINDPASVECPFCHQKMDLENEVMYCTEYITKCEHCGRDLHLKIDIEVTVLAFKPEALR